MILCWKLIAVTLFLLSLIYKWFAKWFIYLEVLSNIVFFFCWFQGDFADVLFVSLVEGFLEWINQYWKECPWSSAGNCFTLFSSLFSIFFTCTTYFLQRWFLFFLAVVGYWDFWQAWGGRAWTCIQGEWSFTAICMYAMCNICCEQLGDWFFFSFWFLSSLEMSMGMNL